MNPTFDRLYRQLGRVTLGLLLGALTLYGITIGCGLLGFSHVTASLGAVAASLAVMFVLLFILFLVASVVLAVVRWMDRRNQIERSSPV
jgi:hypothetical protein